MNIFCFNPLRILIVFSFAILACSREAPPASQTPRESLLVKKEKTTKTNSLKEPAKLQKAKREPQKPAPPPDMLPVPGGEFIMGQDDKGIPDERPAHRVTVKDFFLDITEVTNAAYDRCVKAASCRRPAFLDTEKSGFAPLKVFRTPDRPVVGVSHSNAKAYCAFVGKRLPTEAEWERAARGTDNRLFPWGNEMPTPELAVFRSKVTAPVKSRPKGKGPFGHYDLGGNVWEWVSDHYDPFAYTRDTADRGIPGTCPEILAAQNSLRRQGKQGFTGTNPIPTECEHVLRGGAFNYFPYGLRSTNRVHHAGRFRIAMAGFRCAKDAATP